MESGHHVLLLRINIIGLCFPSFLLVSTYNKAAERPLIAHTVCGIVGC